MNLEAMTEYLDSLIDRGIPSFDCMVYKNHEMIYHHMGGTIDAEYTKPISGKELSLMFSMTKVQTMGAFMQLVEQGKVCLEDEVGTYLPAYQNVMVKKDGTVEKLMSPLKMKHLVSMQSGLDYDLERAGIIRVLKEKGAQATTRELVDSFVETPLNFVPGERFFYSLSQDVVAAVIEVVSGMSFGEYLEKNIWEPLQMKHTFFAKPMNDLKNLATQFICTEQGEIVPMEPSCVYQLSECYQSGGAGLISCREDYMKFADTIACGGVSKDGVRIIKAESIETMKQNLLCDAGREDIARDMGRKGYGYGCGVQVLLEPELIGAKAPAGVFGWDGAAGSCITMDTETGISLVYIQHVRNCGWAYDEIHPTLRDFVFA